MINQQIIANQELYEAIYNADSTIQKVYELKYGKDTGISAEKIYGEEDYRNAVTKNLALAQSAEKSRKKTLWIIPFMVIPFTIGLMPLAWLVIGFILYEIINISNYNLAIVEAFSLVATPIILSLIICTVMFIKVYKSNKYTIYYEAAKENEYLANRKREELETFIEHNKHYIAIIAPEFRYPVASHELLRIFQLGRASTLPEAYDKLELRLHQLKVEEKLDRIIALQISQLGMLSRIEYNTRWTFI